MGKKARENVENRFDINKIADDYLEIYTLLNQKDVKKRMRERSSNW
mgnify:CR=1 FL=1